MSKTTDSISSTCVLCCGGIKYFAVGPCNHHICLKCSTRMRVLCEHKYCAVCRAEMPKVIATAKLHPYNGIISHKYPINRKAGIAFATPQIQDEFRRLLWEGCQLCPLRAPEKNLKELQDHMRKDHELFYCDLCIKHLKVFSFERKAYPRKELALHRRKGDGKDTSYRGHPLCEFCDERYFDNDELLRHLRQQHYFCHFCETDGVSNQYYNDYDNLKGHFREQHYLCEEDHCVLEQFTHAFRSSIDLKAHKATVHTNQMSRAQVRQMRQLDVEINLPPRPFDRGGGGPGFARGRDRRYHGNREEDLSTAIQASMETSRRETSDRQETSDRRDVRRQDREERDMKRSKDKHQPKKKPTTSSEPEDARDAIRSKPLKENADSAGKAAVATETVEKEARVTEERRRVKKKGGRTSPESEGETKTEAKEKKKSIESLEDVSRKQKSVASLADPPETIKETGKRKKNKSKTVSDKADNVSESVTLQSIKKPVDDKPSETSRTLIEDCPSISDAADLNVKSAKLAWTAPDAKVEDFPVLGKSSKASGGNTGAAGGLSFYSALQKMDTQPKPQMQPVAVPARRSFTNKDDDFPTLSSIAGILGVDAAPSRTNQHTKSNNSAWTAPKDKPVTQPIEAKPGLVKSKKKGKKSSKENQEVAISEPKRKPPPGFETQKKEAALTVPARPQGNQTVAPQCAPPGLPSGLAPKVSAPTTVRPVSKAPPLPAASNPVSPPPGFGASISLSNSVLPPGFNVYVPPSDFQERNLTLAKKIRAYLGDQGAKFDMFRSISRRFRDDSMTAADYYNECRVLLGDNLPDIFNELVSLLPDVVKQQELISAQHDVKIKEKCQKDNDVLKIAKSEPVSSKGKGRGSGIWKSKANASCSCPQCGQAIQHSELETHLNMHKDFPTLSTSAVSKRQQIPAAALTWPRLK